MNADIVLTWYRAKHDPPAVEAYIEVDDLDLGCSLGAA
jgi:hypothetical protein